MQGMKYRFNFLFFSNISSTENNWTQPIHNFKSCNRLIHQMESRFVAYTLRHINREVLGKKDCFEFTFNAIRSSGNEWKIKKGINKNIMILTCRVLPYVNTYTIPNEFFFLFYCLMNASEFGSFNFRNEDHVTSQ